MTTPKVKPPRARARGRIWSFRREGADIDVQIKGYPTRRHRKADRRIYTDFPSYIVMDMQRLGLNINIDLTLADARRVYADLGAAIALAETTADCAADCWTCGDASYHAK